MKTESEFVNFEKLVSKIVTVPHKEIRAKLDAERAAKKRKDVNNVSKKRRAGHDH